MDILTIFFIICGMFIVLGIIGVLSLGKRQEKAEIVNYMERCDKAVEKGLNASSAEKVRESIQEVSDAYREVKRTVPRLGDQFHRDDFHELREHLREAEQDQWERKADKYLQGFYDSYSMLESGELASFKDVELLFRYKKRCIDYWQKYFAIDLQKYETTIYPKRYMKEWLGEDYDPCMDSHEALEKKLSSFVQEMRPEYQRKMQLYEILVEYVARRQSVFKTELLKVKIDGFTDEEKRCCYRELLKKNRLVEIKMGNRLFVTLSDKEASKKKWQGMINAEAASNKERSTKKQDNEERPDNSCGVDATAQCEPSETDTAIPVTVETGAYDAARSLLQKKGQEYIDLTAKGGKLYLFDEQIAQELSDQGYKVYYAKNGTKKTAGRPAWYL